MFHECDAFSFNFSYFEVLLSLVWFALFLVPFLLNLVLGFLKWVMTLSWELVFKKETVGCMWVYWLVGLTLEGQAGNWWLWGDLQMCPNTKPLLPRLWRKPVSGLSVGLLSFPRQGPLISSLGRCIGNRRTWSCGVDLNSQGAYFHWASTLSPHSSDCCRLIQGLSRDPPSGCCWWELGPWGLGLLS